MNRAVFAMTVRLRLVTTVLAAVGMVMVIVLVGALFPSVGGTIGKLHVPDGVANLLGGANYGTMTGWMRGEIVSIYGPLVVAAVAIGAAVASTAIEEEAGILALVLAHPVRRSDWMVAKATGTAVIVVIVAIGTWLGLVIGVAVGGGGITLAHLTAFAVHLVGFGLVVGALALALAGATGRKAVAAGGAGAYAVVGFLINGFAPLVAGIAWLRYLSPFYYYEGHDPIANGVDGRDLLVLAVAALALTGVAIVAFQRRDLRA